MTTPTDQSPSRRLNVVLASLRGMEPAEQLEAVDALLRSLQRCKAKDRAFLLARAYTRRLLVMYGMRGDLPKRSKKAAIERARKAADEVDTVSLRVGLHRQIDTLTKMLDTP